MTDTTTLDFISDFNYLLNAFKKLNDKNKTAQPIIKRSEETIKRIINQQQ